MDFAAQDTNQHRQWKAVPVAAAALGDKAGAALGDRAAVIEADKRRHAWSTRSLPGDFTADAGDGGSLMRNEIPPAAGGPHRDIGGQHDYRARVTVASYRRR